MRCSEVYVGMRRRKKVKSLVLNERLMLAFGDGVKLSASCQHLMTISNINNSEQKDFRKRAQPH